jgi:hypothetical protein
LAVSAVPLVKNMQNFFEAFMDWLNRLKQATETIPAEFPDTKKREPSAFHDAAEIIKSETNTKTIWRNPYPKGTPEARAESLRVIEAARRGEPIPLYYETSELSSSSPVVENRPLTEKIVHIPKAKPTKDKKTQPPVKGGTEWLPDVQALVDWFLKLEPREIKPFHLEPHIHVADPVQFYESLRREIQTGPGGARAKMGTLQDDMRKLKAHLN